MEFPAGSGCKANDLTRYKVDTRSTLYLIEVINSETQDFKSSYAYHFSPLKFSRLLKLLLYDYMHVHTVFACFLQSASIICSF